MTKIQQLWDEQKQSLWLDDISRTMLQTGALRKQIEQDGIRGVTSNPSIFEKAIASGHAYDDQVAELLRAGKSSGEIFEAVEVDDIRDACDLFADLYKASGGQDGYVSIEVAPEFARDTEGTLNEARRLWASVNRPNLMVKIPGTAEGLPAIKQALIEGISINVTLLFSVERYAEVAVAHVEALEARHAAGQSIETLASVASFFVSRVDTLIDKLLDEKIATGDAKVAEVAGGLQGKIAVANAKLAYQKYLEIFESERFAPLKAAGGNVQRPLWASTGTKNPNYSDVLYVESLIGPNTVNTMPGKTIEAFVDHGRITRSVDTGVTEARDAIAKLAELGIDLQAATAQLEEEGIATFAKAFDSLIAGVESKRAELAGTVA
ncbi:MAG TPA: transaldolase [Thermomicrobiales bacterium]|nr:transaldolase [Thermomicrobiales bacterium]